MKIDPFCQDYTHYCVDPQDSTITIYSNYTNSGKTVE